MAVPAAVAAAAKKKAIAKGVKIGGSVTVGFIIVCTLASFGFAMSIKEMNKQACGPGAAAGASVGLPAIDPAPGGYGDPDPQELERFMFAKREMESDQDYTIQSQSSTASGAYQYVDGTWNSPEHKAIWSRYGNYPRAYLAPPAVQDEVARFDFVSYWHTYGNWAQVSMMHYVPSWVDDPSKWDTVPEGNRLTLRQYAEQVLKIMDQAPDFPAGTDANSVDCRAQFDVHYVGDGTAGSMAVESAIKYIGIGYRYGGGQVAGTQWQGMDCSAFVFNAYRDIGVTIGVWTGAQIDNGVSVGTSLSNARPGDLIILGSSRTDTSHVVMYYKYEGGKHIVIESNGAGSDCRAANPTYGANPNCRGIGPPHEFRDSRTILDIRRILCSTDSAGQPVPCNAN